MNLLLLIGAGAAALTALIILIKYVLVGTRRVVWLFDIILGDADNPSLDIRLGNIEEQLRPNDGKTLRDRVDYIALQCQELQRTQVEQDGFIFGD